jgi:broad specificity phosphatase PhoE
MRARFPTFIERWTEDPGTAQMPGGESLTQVQKRAWAAVSALAEQHPDESVVVVSHNFTNLAIVTHVLDAPMRYFRRLRQELGSITRLEINKDHNVLVSLNETAHLQGIE